MIVDKLIWIIFIKEVVPNLLTFDSDTSMVLIVLILNQRKGETDT